MQVHRQESEIWCLSDFYVAAVAEIARGTARGMGNGTISMILKRLRAVHYVQCNQLPPMTIRHGRCQSCLAGY